MDCKVLIGVPTAEVGRKATFQDHLGQIDMPQGTIIAQVHGQSPARNRNIIIEQALAHDCSHILFIDDDTVPPTNILSKLLAHNKDIVTGLYLMRNYPHKPIIFDYVNKIGECRNHYPQDTETGLIEIVNCGLGAVLIKTEVFKKVEKPWIRLGELDVDHWSDDIGFFNRCRAAGYKLYCDLSVEVGHTGFVTIMPEYRDGKWFTSYYTDGEGKVGFPSIKPTLEELEKNNAELARIG